MLRVLAWEPRNWRWSKSAWRYRYVRGLHDLGIQFVSSAPDLVLCCQTTPPDEFADYPTVVEINMDAITIQPEMVPWIEPSNVVACFRNALYRYPVDYTRPYVERDHYGCRWAEFRRESVERTPAPVLRPELLGKLRLALPLYTPPSEAAFRFTQNFPPLTQRPIDVCFAGRMRYDGNGWPERHRALCKRVFRRLPGRCEWRDYESGGGLSYRAYLTWMQQAKIAISPWGWTAWNIRDYEALMCGCILIKPECSGILSLPDLYDPWQNLVLWCSPDFSDLHLVVARALDELQSRQERVQYGRRLLEDTIMPRPLLEHWAKELKAAVTRERVYV